MSDDCRAPDLHDVYREFLRLFEEAALDHNDAELEDAKTALRLLRRLFKKELAK